MNEHFPIRTDFRNLVWWVCKIIKKSKKSFMRMALVLFAIYMIVCVLVAVVAVYDDFSIEPVEVHN